MTNPIKTQIKRKNQVTKMIENQATITASSVKIIIQKLAEGKNLNPSRLTQLLKEANIQAEDLIQWEDFNHPPEDSYGRKLIYQGDDFEILVMSWSPGDFSTIHDHGNTKWGAVQIFGPAEHATFRLEDGQLSTVARWQVNTGDILGVSHTLIHQMGNPHTDQSFISLHIYGVQGKTDNITGDSRVFDLDKDEIQRTDGGVFFALPEAEINSVETGITSDFHTCLRHRVELSRRLLKIDKDRKNKSTKTDNVIRKTFSIEQLPQFLSELKKNTDTNGHVQNSVYWKILSHELREASNLQDELNAGSNASDSFHQYAEMYDSLICQPMLESFMANYLAFFKENFVPDLAAKSLISLGVGTGLIEKFMLDNLGLQHNNLYGIDISESMVTEARKRIRADIGDVLTLDSSVKLWDIAYCGLNVFHYLDHTDLETAIMKTASIVKPGGWFLGDFITPDHMRWYPNVVYSTDDKVVSMRTPRLVEEDGKLFQESEIVNVDFSGEQLIINYAGKHKRFLPPLHRIRRYFENAFGGDVKLYDAHSMELIPLSADTCESTRYVVVAQKR
jgi:predicted metal-dependent enzyme (double-stranded beta helix superfamily)/SAM-dependent methyltransferase